MNSNAMSDSITNLVPESVGSIADLKSHTMKHMVSDDVSFGSTLHHIGQKPKIRKMYIAAIAALVMAIALGMATGYSAPATYNMVVDPKSKIKPNQDQVTWIGSMLSLGLILGGLSAGPLADILGRQRLLMFNVIPFVIGWGLIFYAEYITEILIGRFICGMAIGVICVALPMYTVEISTPEVRGLLGSSFQGFLVIGNLISMVAGYYLNWTWLAYCAACFPVFGMIVLLPMPESPRWLIANNQVEEAKQSIDFLQGGFLDSVEECNNIIDDLKNQPRGKISFKEFKHPSVYKPTLLGISIYFFQQFSGANSVFFYSSSIFEISSSLIDPKIASIILAAVQVIATLLSNQIVDKAGRKILLLISGGLMAISISALGAYYFVSSQNETFKANYSWMPLSSLTVCTIAYSTGYGPIPPLLIAEMVPLRARSTASAVAMFSNGIFGFIILKTFAQLEDALGRHGTFWVYSAMSVLGCIFVGFFLPETKGKKLEDMAKIFLKQKPIENSSDTYSLHIDEVNAS